MRMSAVLEPFPGFAGVTNEDSVDKFAGASCDATPDLFVDLSKVDVPQPATWPELVSIVLECAQCCSKLRAKTAVTAASLSMHQICALVESVVLKTLPPPEAWSPELSSDTSAWVPAPDYLTLAEQRSVLRALYELSAHYVSAFKSLKYDRTKWGAYVVTCSTLLAHFEHAIRLIAADEPSKVTQCIFRSKADLKRDALGDELDADNDDELDLEVCEVPPDDQGDVAGDAGAEETKQDAGLHDLSSGRLRPGPLRKQGSDTVPGAVTDGSAWRKPKSAVSKRPPMFKTSVNAFNRDTFAALTARCLIVDPQVAVARAHVMACHGAQRGTALPNGGRVMFNCTPFYERGSPTDEFMAALVLLAGLDDEMPQTLLEKLRANDDLERPAEVYVRAHWYSDGLPDVPEFGWYRDITLLHSVRVWWDVVVHRYPSPTCATVCFGLRHDWPCRWPSFPTLLSSTRPTKHGSRRTQNHPCRSGGKFLQTIS